MQKMPHGFQSMPCPIEPRFSTTRISALQLHRRLQSKLTYQPVGFDFTAGAVLVFRTRTPLHYDFRKEIDRRNFRKKMLSFGIVEETNEFGDKKADVLQNCCNQQIEIQ